MKKFEKGITLIALIITIIIMLILVSVSLRLAIQSGLFDQAGQAVQKTKTAQEEEDKLSSGQITIDGKETDIDKYLASLPNTENWDSTKRVNKPKLTEDMQGFYLDNEGNEIIVTEENYDNWYDYANGNWAQAKTADGISWVWIPRYAYKITSGVKTDGDKTIEIKFLQGNTNKDFAGTTISKNYPTVENAAMTDFVVHPAFTDGTSNNFANGEWDSELEGIWVTAEVQPRTDIITAYTSLLEYDSNKNSHLIKNSEHGAILYLKNSPYNDSSAFIFGAYTNIHTACVGGELDSITNSLGFVYDGSQSTSIKETKYFSVYDGPDSFGDYMCEIFPALSSFTSFSGKWLIRNANRF